MIKKRFAFLLIPIFVVCLIVEAHAHPGRTDSRGGHTNHSTGEYHYHHGYSAHDHYDMDGDDRLDCPYEFKNNTDHSAISSFPDIDVEYPSYEQQINRGYRSDDVTDNDGPRISRYQSGESRKQSNISRENPTTQTELRFVSGDAGAETSVFDFLFAFFVVVVVAAILRFILPS